MKIWKWIIGGLMIPGLAFGDGTWNDDYQGTDTIHEDPTDSTNASAIDDHMRSTRNAVGNRAEVEHHWGFEDGTNDDNGLHRLGSARCYMSDTPPVDLQASHSSAAGVRDYVIDGTTGVDDLEDSASQSAAGAEDDVGHGRCWIDTDDNNRLYFFVGVAGDNTPSTVADAWVPASTLGGGNLILHGTFDSTDGDGAVNATVLPVGWTLTGSATIAYTDPITQGFDGEGLMMQTTTGGAATDEGVSQTLGGLHEATWYRFSVRAKANSDDTCQLAITGASRTVPSAAEVETSGTTFETLSILALTNATPTDLVMLLRGPDNSDVCNWKHASAVKLSGGADPGTTSFVATSTTKNINCANSYTSASCDKLVSIIVNPPGPGYIVSIQGSVQIHAAANAICWLELFDESASAQRDEVFHDTGSDASEISLRVSYISTTVLVPGVPVEYSLNAKEEGQQCTIDPNSRTTLYTSRIQALLIPSGR